MSLSPPEYIRHILDEIDYILSRISDMDYETFVRDETLKMAFVRSIEVIGEASKKLPENIKTTSFIIGPGGCNIRSAKQDCIVSGKQGYKLALAF